MGLIGQTQQTTFADPQAGQSPISAAVVRGNDNALVAKHNAHDADATIHVQTGLLSARPAASVAGAMYLDENGRLYRDNGSAWAEVSYASLGASSNTFTGNVAVNGGLAVDGSTALATTGVTGNLTVTGDVSAATVTATGLTTGTAAATSITVTGGQAVAAQHTLGNITGSVTVDWNNGNAQRGVLTGNVTISFSNMIAGASYSLMLVQDGTGGRSITLSGVAWEGGVAPTFVTTAGRGSLVSLYSSGTGLAAVLAGTGFSSV
jgi:cytoskeletal protein CcmA (bactofilin family)